MTQTNEIIELALKCGIEIGKWLGQVELEEFYDRNQYGMAALESIYARKNAMPFGNASVARDVTIGLRSQQWRDGVRRTCELKKEAFLEQLTQLKK